MSKGPGRLERAVMRAVFPGIEFSTEELCRRAYPDVGQIEKRHRVAVLQVLHRMMEPPRDKLSERRWVITRGTKRGSWIAMYTSEVLPLRTLEANTAHHEAGHALVMYYLGMPPTEAWMDPEPLRLRRRPPRAAIEINGVTLTPAGLVSRKPWHRGLDLDNLMISAAGPIAEGHFLGKWPWRRRGIGPFCAGAWETGGAGDNAHIEQYLDNLHADPAIRAAVREKAEKKSQALIRSEPGWQFIESVAAALQQMKRGTVIQSRMTTIFRRCFGRPPPRSSDWFDYPVTLARCRSGWLPPSDMNRSDTV